MNLLTDANNNSLSGETTTITLSTTKIQHLSAISIRFIVLVLFLMIAFIENFLLLLLSIGPVSKWFRGRQENKCFLANTPAISRRHSEGQSRKPMTPAYDNLNNKNTEDLARVKVRPSFLEIDQHSGSSTTARFTRYYFGNLCLANILLVLVALPATLIVCFGVNSMETSSSMLRNDTEANLPHSFLSNQKMSTTYCVLIEISVVTLAFAIIFCLVQMTGDRLLAVCQPFRYPKYMTPRRAFANIMTGWIFAIFLGALPPISQLFHEDERKQSNSSCTESTIDMEDVFKCFVFGQHSKEGHFYFVITYFTLAYLIPVVFMIMAYLIMYHKARQLNQRSLSIHMRKRWNDQKSAGNSTCQHNHQQQDHHLLLVQPTLINSAGENRAAFRAFWLVATFLSLTLPYFLLMLKSGIKNFSGSPEVEDHSARDLDEVIRSICVWLLYVNATITPGIYAYTDRVLRKRFLGVFVNRMKNSKTTTTTCLRDEPFNKRYSTSPL